jgi:hypothetical protein
MGVQKCEQNHDGLDSLEAKKKLRAKGRGEKIEKKDNCAQ